MCKITSLELRKMWEAEGYWGKWRELLKQGLRSDELYFEFGLIPERKPGLDYRIVLEHKATVWLQSENPNLESEYVIQKSNREVNLREIKENERGLKLHKFYISDEQYANFLIEANLIFQEYQDEDRGCFWSIPAHWFRDLSLVDFIGQNIIKDEYFTSRPFRNLDWYWP